MKENILERFLRYTAIDTQSQEDSETYPSTMKQYNLLNLLKDELVAMGINATVNGHGYVMATIPSNLGAGKNEPPKVAFIAHVDTSPDVSGENVKPQILKNYDGKDIVLPADNSVVIRTSENPNLLRCVGKTVITTDGMTLLGADDKAGVSIIMTLAEYLLAHPEIKHGELKIGFTPDEEVGMGTAHFDVKEFGADYAYTLDGDAPGELNMETFTAKAATIKVVGRDIHPGFGKDIMVNASRVAGEIVSRLPKDMAPETTDGYQPFIHPHHVSGDISNAVIKMLLRAFDMATVEKEEEILKGIIADVQAIFPRAGITLEVKESYRNMREIVEKHPQVTDNLWSAAVKAGVEPKWEPIRGGTDGSRLSWMGLPCPNVYTGGQNFHSRTEWACLEWMETSFQTVLNLVQIWAEKAN